jgi:Icc-related predicted phosphoesterase
MNILSVSDVVLNNIYSTQIKNRFSHVDLVISCGDLPYYYLEYIISTLNKPLYYVRGNHAHKVEHGISEKRTGPWGGIDVHRKCVRDPQSGLLIAGIEGSIRYNRKPSYQYTQFEMWVMVFKLVPRLVFNKLRWGRYLDIFISHAPPWQIQDRDDLPHQGVKAFRWLLKVFKPAAHLHGHIHIYDYITPRETQYQDTKVINTYGYREMKFEPNNR